MLNIILNKYMVVYWVLGVSKNLKFEKVAII